MGISLSNKDYIAFTIKEKKERKEKRHDYDATADYNKNDNKRAEKERERGGKKKGKRKPGESASDAPSANRLHAKGERRCGRTGCVRGAYAN